VLIPALKDKLLENYLAKQPRKKLMDTYSRMIDGPDAQLVCQKVELKEIKTFSARNSKDAVSRV